jgi:hypothetical protein
MPKRVRELLKSLGGQVGRRDILEVLRLAPLYLMWCIWRAQNARRFDNRETSVAELKKIIFNALYTWIAAHNSLFFLVFKVFEPLFFFFN